MFSLSLYGQVTVSIVVDYGKNDREKADIPHQLLTRTRSTKKIFSLRVSAMSVDSGPHDYRLMVMVGVTKQPQFLPNFHRFHSFPGTTTTTTTNASVKPRTLSSEIRKESDSLERRKRNTRNDAYSTMSIV